MCRNGLPTLYWAEMVVQKYVKLDFVMIVPTEDDVLRIATAYMQYYRETGIYGERTALLDRTFRLRSHKGNTFKMKVWLLHLNERFQTARSTYTEAWGQALIKRSH